MQTTGAAPSKRSPATAHEMRAATVDIRKILVPTDFSETAFSAVEAAVTIAQAYGSIITLAHSSSAVPFAAGEAVIPDLLVDQLADDEQRMCVLLERLPALAYLHVETVVEFDAAVPMIHDLIRARRPDLVVLGSSGARGIERIALGSVAENIARSAAVPVLIVGPNIRSARELFKSILFATDLKSTGLCAAQYASAIAARFRSRLALLHVIEHKSPASATGTESEDRLRQNLKSLVKTGECAPEFIIRYGQAAEQILEVAASTKSTLLVLGAHRSALMADHLPSTTLSHIIREAACAVLVVRDRVS